MTVDPTTQLLASVVEHSHLWGSPGQAPFWASTILPGTLLAGFIYLVSAWNKKGHQLLVLVAGGSIIFGLLVVYVRHHPVSCDRYDNCPTDHTPWPNPGENVEARQ